MEILSTCLARDLPIYRLTYKALLEHFPGAIPHVVTRKPDFPKFRNACGSDLHLWDENDLVPDMTLQALKAYPLPFFPAGAGWYFQQFLKWAFVEVSNSDSHYLIWDADTVPLRHLDFFDPEGRPYLTTSSEYHQPYFQTFEALTAIRPLDHTSFISQHQIIDKAILRELLNEIIVNHPNTGGWAWSIIESMRGQGTNLFSEYETYGHYCRTTHPDRCVVRKLLWNRDGQKLAGFPPHMEKLSALARNHVFISFESNRSLKGWCVHWLRKLLNWY